MRPVGRSNVAQTKMSRDVVRPNARKNFHAKPLSRKEEGMNDRVRLDERTVCLKLKVEEFKQNASTFAKKSKSRALNTAVSPKVAAKVQVGIAEFSLSRISVRRPNCKQKLDFGRQSGVTMIQPLLPKADIFTRRN